MHITWRKRSVPPRDIIVIFCIALAAILVVCAIACCHLKNRNIGILPNNTGTDEDEDVHDGIDFGRGV